MSWIGISDPCKGNKELASTAIRFRGCVTVSMMRNKPSRKKGGAAVDPNKAPGRVQTHHTEEAKEACSTWKWRKPMS
jgi:hypothetical protein